MRKHRTSGRRSVTIVFTGLMALLSLVGAGGMQQLAAAPLVPAEEMGSPGGGLTNEGVALRYFDEVHTHGDVAAAAQIISADAAIHTPDGELVGPDGVIGLVTVLRTAFPDARFPIRSLIGNGDTVTVRWSMTGTHDGDFQGIAATGAAVAMEGIAVLRFERGMIVENWVQYDRLALLQQIGAMPGPAASVPEDPRASANLAFDDPREP